MQSPRNKSRRAFTLIELSIVLVIIGLIVGGVLVGQDLIRAAETRAQIAQIEKFATAANTFKGKFNYLPGDMTGAAALQYGFTVGVNCNGAMGQRNGDGLIDGYPSIPLIQGSGETALFWEDISSAAAGGLIDGTFPGNGVYTNCTSAAAVVLSGTNLGLYFPAAKIGHANYVYVYEVSGNNWFGVEALTNTYNNGGSTTGANIPVMQAYNMDKKMDDGNPTTGNVLATYITNSTINLNTAPNAASDSAATCYNTTGPAYSITYNNGNGGNCALSFRFQ